MFDMQKVSGIGDGILRAVGNRAERPLTIGPRLAKLPHQSEKERI